jgi:hypothetical protein
VLFSWKDAEKSERRSRRINELEAINNQVKLLTEMVDIFGPSSSRDDIEMMKVSVAYEVVQI